MLKHIRKHEDKSIVEQGFTLIELLVVVAILGILAAVAIFAVGNLTDNAKKNACATEASTVETAAEAFNAQAGRYPTLAEMQATTVVGTVTVEANLKTAPTHNSATNPPPADAYNYNSSTGAVTRGSACVGS